MGINYQEYNTNKNKKSQHKIQNYLILYKYIYWRQSGYYFRLIIC